MSMPMQFYKRDYSLKIAGYVIIEGYLQLILDQIHGCTTG